MRRALRQCRRAARRCEGPTGILSRAGPPRPSCGSPNRLTPFLAAPGRGPGEPSTSISFTAFGRAGRTSGGSRAVAARSAASGSGCITSPVRAARRGVPPRAALSGRMFGHGRPSDAAARADCAAGVPPRARARRISTGYETLSIRRLSPSSRSPRRSGCGAPGPPPRRSRRAGVAAGASRVLGTLAGRLGRVYDVSGTRIPRRAACSPLVRQDPSLRYQDADRPRNAEARALLGFRVGAPPKQLELLLRRDEH